MIFYIVKRIFCKETALEIYYEVLKIFSALC